MEKILSQMWYSLAHYSGKEGVYKAATALYPKKITLRKVATFLSKQFTYSMHKPVLYHFKTNQIFAEGTDYQWQANLADLGSVQKYNEVFRYLLTCIDVSQNMPGSYKIFHCQISPQQNGPNPSILFHVTK